MCATGFGRSIVAVAVLLFSVIPAAGQGVGAIGGNVSDTSVAMLPGAAVTLSSPQGTLGAYQFLRLVPGTYTVKAEL